ncbi:hypothetical protein [Denitromonas iodatirespirans]|uniref:Uncharacterized protein n=1 Tax=Denitromonas iodatirespirans TaxID=2795389 RepID=A0A944D5H4_DENI1|nr:hypothetical protein [Denitromonas iodatirespirans]MBT0960345.1 hypothetical protein [Denitromonas iodatirespirans]
MSDTRASLAPRRGRAVVAAGLGLVALLLVAGIALWLRGDIGKAAASMKACLAQPAATSAAAPMAEPALTSADLAQMSDRIDILQQRIGTLDPRLAEIQRSIDKLADAVGSMTGSVATLLERIPEHKPAPRKVLRRRAAPKSAPTVAMLPTVVAVDQWGSAANATVRNSDGSIRFVRAGDVIGKARVVAIDTAARAVTLRLADGKNSTLRVAR